MPVNQVNALTKGFDEWQNSLEKLQRNAEISFMPLLAKVFELAQEVLKVYRKGFLNKAQEQIGDKDA